MSDPILDYLPKDQLVPKPPLTSNLGYLPDLKETTQNFLEKKLEQLPRQETYHPFPPPKITGNDKITQLLLYGAGGLLALLAIVIGVILIFH